MDSRRCDGCFPMTMFGYWIARVTYGFSAIDWHREWIDNSWALTLAMGGGGGGLVLAVYFCYSLPGVTLSVAYSHSGTCMLKNS